MSAVLRSAPKFTRDGLRRLLLLAAVATFGVWIARNTYWEEVSQPAQPRGEAATNPYYGIQRLAADLGLRTRTVTSLSSLPGRDGVLLLDSVSNRNLPRIQVLALEHWVEAGGRLLLAGPVLGGSAELRRWTGIKFVASRVPGSGAAAPDAAAPNPPGRSRAKPAAGVGRKDCPPMQLSVDGTATGETLQVCDVWVGNGYTSELTPSWALRDAAGIQVLRLGLGAGSVTVFGPTQLYGNTELFEHQHARVFVDAAALSRGDELWILVPNRAEPLLALLWRIAAPAIACLGAAVALSLWRGFPRFGPLAHTPPVARRSLAEQIRANARFAWRSHSLAALHGAALRGVEDGARRRITAFDRLDAARRAAEIAARTNLPVRELEQAMRPGVGRRPAAERTAIALVERARRRLLTPTGTSQKDPA